LSTVGLAGIMPGFDDMKMILIREGKAAGDKDHTKNEGGMLARRDTIQECFPL